MDAEYLQLTVEDMLVLHRVWITDLFVDGNGNEMEIIKLLYEGGLFTTLPLLRSCLRDWGLLSPRFSTALPQPKLDAEMDIRQISLEKNRELHNDTRSVSDTWSIVDAELNTRTRSRLSTSSNVPLRPDSPTCSPSPVITDFDDLESINLYRERPLPAAPKRRSSSSFKRPAKDKLRLTCHHGDEFHAVEMTLGILGQGPTPIETYASDDQAHERIAVRLERDSERNIQQLPTVPFRRSARAVRNGSSRSTRRRLSKDKLNKKKG